MEVLLHQIDAFTDAPFSGNPAAVMPLPGWLPDQLLLDLAQENNLAETAFYTSQLPPDAGPPPGAGPAFHLRWFTPTVEVELCGHATLASAAQILEDVYPGVDQVNFYTRSGWLRVDRTDDDEYVLDLPALASTETEPDPALVAALGVRPVRAYTGFDEILVLGSEQEVRDATPDFAAFPPLRFDAVITALGDTSDIVSRVFGPALGVAEDPVTGSAHAQLIPLWCRELGRSRITARQLSRRGGSLRGELDGDRVFLYGRCRRYLDGVVTLPD
ncbi:PhzF family phenazine biosynthesis protein [Nocardia sp. XZ_19_385]|uniref:PhzF family phenazine biosynthesis protein n=1 Tax=Nocardia sp. XZ_19_385 TaxID=2769488 RepID=UPI00188E53B6|nr:PhzF family phenazine biosynthesis protein [Nocardia sp. XZ_19_385]